TQTGKEVLSLAAKEQQVGLGSSLLVRSVSFSPDGKRLAANGKVWDVQTGKEVLSLKGLPAPASAVVFSPNGKHLVSRAGRPVWDAQTGEQLLPANAKEGTAFASTVSTVVSPDGKRLALAAMDHVKLCDLQTGQELLSIPMSGGFGSVVAFSRDGHRLGHVSIAGTVTIWDATPLAEKH